MWRQFSAAARLPIGGTTHGLSFTIDALQDRDWPGLLDILHTSSQDETGFDPQSITNVDNLRTFVSKQYGGTNFGIKVKQCNEQELQGYFTIHDSRLSRSTVPNAMGIFGIFHPWSRTKNISSGVAPIMHEMGRQMGYTSYSYRVAIANAASLKYCLKRNESMQGLIPRSIQHSQYGWTPDVIITNPLQKQHNSNQQWIVPATVTTVAVQSLVPNGDVSLTVAEGNDLVEANRLLCQAAKLGAGFGVDEFLENGEFDGKFLSNKTFYLARDASGHSVGVGVLGASNLVRQNSSQTAGCYLYVQPQFRGRQLARWLLQQLEQLAVNSGYVAMTTDVYTNNNRGLKLMLNCGYSAFGTLPECGQIAGIGWTDSIVLHRMLDQ